MNNYIESFTGFYDGLSIYLEKYAQRPERDKNHASILQLAGDYYEEYQDLTIIRCICLSFVISD